MFKLIIFDFDGVLNNSFNQVYKIHKIACGSIKKKTSKKEFRALFVDGNFHASLRNYLDIPDNIWEKFKEKKYSIYQNYYRKSKLFIFSKRLIVNLFNKKSKLVIISSAPKESIENKLKEYNLDKYFIDIIGINALGKTKSILDLMLKLNIKQENVLFITDTVGDIKDGKEAGVKIAAVSWGFHNNKKLKSVNPDYLVNYVWQLISIC